MKSGNTTLKFILTVSPVPLTASASGEHVLAATTYSKSVLRAVAGELCQERDDVDYFPSYEMITGAPFRSMFYQPNLRSISRQGIKFVMNSFFACMESTCGASKIRTNDSNTASRTKAKQRDSTDTICEEEMLDTFGGKRK
jgi:hypothetical protein